MADTPDEASSAHQLGALLVFLNIADLEERANLHAQYADYARENKQALAKRKRCLHRVPRRRRSKAYPVTATPLML